MSFHQNFDFSIGCDLDLPVPKCLLLLMAPQQKQRFFLSRCDQGSLTFHRQLAFACQIDLINYPLNIDWSQYDFVFMANEGYNQKFPRPKNLPIILYCHDFQIKNKGYQWVINWIKPDILLTSYPTQWKENFKLPLKTKVVFYPLFLPLFFSRPNLERKDFDLLVIGAAAGEIYQSRYRLSRQIFQLSHRYKIIFSHSLGYLRGKWQGPTYHLDSNNQPIRYLNKWSEYLGKAKYVIFGRIGDPRKQFLVYKYYETLGSGAIPIFPEVPDLELLGVKSFVHYIPLSEIEENNKRLSYFLDRYEDFKYIAENAVKWYKENSDKILFEGFEDLIREITNQRYPKRLI
jgi:hypothetical protein